VIFIVVTFEVRPEYSDDWLTLVGPFTEATRAEPGNLWFDWSRDLEDPDRFVLLEAFRDAEAGAAHVGSAHFHEALALMPPLLRAVPRIVNVEVPGTDWSRLAEMELPDGS